MAMRAAPVQATFLGYPHSTGLSRIDCLIGDPVVPPAEHDHLFSEGIAQLPGSVFCWSPVDAYPLPPPRPADAPLLVGSFKNIMKLSPRTIALWVSVLHELPEALLLLKAPSLGDASVIERFRTLLAEQGIPAGRLRLEGPEGLEAMMQRYGVIDIALDPTPYNGGGTTLQALWMGVPVISLAGGHFVSRMDASFLTALGKPSGSPQTTPTTAPSPVDSPLICPPFAKAAPACASRWPARGSPIWIATPHTFGSCSNASGGSTAAVIPAGCCPPSAEPGATGVAARSSGWMLCTRRRTPNTHHRTQDATAILETCLKMIHT
jgi:hypothetical protein